MVASMEEPPTEKNGSGLPVMGKSEIAQPILRYAWNTSIVVKHPESPRENGLAQRCEIFKPK